MVILPHGPHYISGQPKLVLMEVTEFQQNIWALCKGSRHLGLELAHISSLLLYSVKQRKSQKSAQFQGMKFRLHLLKAGAVKLHVREHRY